LKSKVLQSATLPPRAGCPHRRPRPWAEISQRFPFRLSANQSWHEPELCDLPARRLQISPAPAISLISRFFQGAKKIAKTT